MTGELWKWGWWLVATLGIGGTIALIAFFPAAAGIALKAVVQFFSIVLSYRIGCAIVAAVLAAFIADYWRHSTDDAEYARRVAAFEQAQDDRDARIKTETRAEVLAELAAAKIENDATDKDVKDFTDALPPVSATGNPFRVGDDAVRLRRLAGQAERGPVRAQRVPQTDAKPTSLRDRIRKRLPGGGGGVAGRDQQGQ